MSQQVCLTRTILCLGQYERDWFWGVTGSRDEILFRTDTVGVVLPTEGRRTENAGVTRRKLSLKDGREVGPGNVRVEE